MTSGAALVGLCGVVGVVLLAVCGPFFAPHSPSEPVGLPFSGPSWSAVLGTDFLGRDVLSRVLWGGRSAIGLALAATALAYAVGVTVGLTAGYTRSWTDGLLMRAVDVVLAFPPILFLLVIVTGTGPSVTALVLAVAATQVPGIARIVRTATLDASGRAYVEAAVSRGERTAAVLGREILPNIASTVLADAGIRLTGSILLIASVNFLGLGLQPPSADWALMVSENRGGLTLNPWAIATPALLIAVLTISVNLAADGIAEGLGSSGLGVVRR